MSLEPVFFMEGADWPALLADAEGRIQTANVGARKLFGEALQGGTANLQSVWPQDAELSWKTVLAKNNGASFPAGRIKFKDTHGMDREKIVCCSPHAGKQGLFLLQFFPAAALGSSTAMSGSSTAQSQKLECALQLARTVASDLNNMLTSILGHTSLVLSKLEPGSPLKASLVEIEKSAAKAADIANDLGVFSSPKRDQKHAATGNLNTILRRCVEQAQESASGEAVHWSFQFDKNLFGAKFDEAKISQAITKILDNAVESLTGSAERRITFSTRSLDLTAPSQDRNVQLNAGAYVCIEINDTGCGIKPEVLPRIFEPFFTTKGGTHRGLGLAWVYGILTNHGGGVAVSSEPGAGTSVRMYLPADRSHLVDTVSPADLQGSQRILLVDDEELLLSMGQTILSSFGYSVTVASNGPKALQLLQTTAPPFDLLITDLVMPGMNGSELAEHARQISPATRVLCTSGFVSNANREAGANYLQKPFTTQELLVKIKETLASG